MGKFDGIIICTDLDDTLLTSDKTVSEENKEAIKYFMDEGGIYTYATGRVLKTSKMIFKYTVPNAPIIACNGVIIYDAPNDKILWSLELDSDYKKIMDAVKEKFPQVGMYAYIEKGEQFVARNSLTDWYINYAGIDGKLVKTSEITDPAYKVVFFVEEEKMDELREFVWGLEWSNKFNFSRSEPIYFEMLPKGAGKGEALIKLAEILGTDKKKTVGIGNYENDLSLVKEAGVGVAVANAISSVLDAGDYITVDHDSHALKAVIEAIENGTIKM